MMTVAELIKELQKYSGDFEVILQKDPEGNGYSPAAGVEDALYLGYEECWSNPEIYEEYYDEEYEANCVVLWPLF